MPPGPPFAFRPYPSAVLDIEGVDRAAFLQGQLASDVRLAQPGRAIAAVGLTPKGKLLYAGRLLGMSDRLRLLIPATDAEGVRERERERERVLAHLRKYAAFQKVSIADRTDEFARIAFYGPGPAPDESAPAEVWPGGEGEIDSEWLVAAAHLPSVLARLAADGGRLLTDEEARILRIESGRPEWSVDADVSHLPDEAGFAGAISTTKGCYVGQEIVARLRTYGRTNRRLVGFRFPDGLLPPGAILRQPGDPPPEPSRIELGRVTSSAESPRFGPIGLGYAFREIAVGDRLVGTEEPSRSAVVSALPFS